MTIVDFFCNKTLNKFYLKIFFTFRDLFWYPFHTKFYINISVFTLCFLAVVDLTPSLWLYHVILCTFHHFDRTMYVCVMCVCVGGSSSGLTVSEFSGHIGCWLLCSWNRLKIDNSDWEMQRKTAHFTASRRQRETNQGIGDKTYPSGANFQCPSLSNYCLPLHTNDIKLLIYPWWTLMIRVLMSQSLPQSFLEHCMVGCLTHEFSEGHFLSKLYHVSW